MSRSARPPLSPEAAAVVRAMSGGRLSRRRFLGGAGALGLTAVLAACGSSSSSATISASGALVPGIDVSETDRTVRWANWPLYLDKDDTTKKFPTLEAFAQTTGITPSYFEEIEDNNTYYDKIHLQLSQGQDLGRDLITLTDWMAARLIKDGWIQKIDRQKYVPNAANILPRLRNVDYDPGRNYSLTWQSGFTGLAWNVDKLRQLTGKTQLTSLDELWDPRLAGRIEVLSEMRDTIGIIMRSQGANPSKAFAQDAFDAAITLLEKQMQSGQIRQVQGNSYTDDLTSGDAVAVIGWSGDIIQLNSQARSANKSLTSDPFGFAFPESGGMMWSDNLMIPIGATHKQNAELLMNYYYDPKVAAEVAAYVNYVCPVQGAQDEIRRLPGIDRAVASSRFIFPTQQDLEQVATFRTLSTQEDNDFTNGFRAVLGS